MELAKIEEKSKLSNSDQNYFKQVHQMLDDNLVYEKKYPRESFSLTLRGKGISEFKNTFEARKMEIFRCKNIQHINQADLIRERDLNDHLDTRQMNATKLLMNAKNEKREIIIEVSTYAELVILMQPWPYNAFGKGVKPFLNGIETLPLTIFDVDKSVVLKTNTPAMSNLALQYGITDVERNYFKNNIENPARTLSALPCTTKAYIDAIKRKVLISSQLRTTKANTKFAKLCWICSSDEHKSCDNASQATSKMPNCKNCCLEGHLTENCKNPTRCKNCKRAHRSDSEKCHRLKQRTYAENDYVLSILLGEGIIRHESDILRNPDAGNTNGIDREEVQEIVDEMITKNQTIKDMNDKLEKQDQENKIIKEKLIELSQADSRLMDEINSVKTNLETTKYELMDKIETTAATQAESAAAQAMRTDEKMDILIEMMRQQQAQQTEANKNSKKRDKKDKRDENGRG